MKHFKSLFKNPTHKSIPLVLFIFLFLIAINSYSFKVEYEQLVDLRSSMEEQKIDLQWDSISNIIHASDISSKNKARYISKKIELELIKGYDNIGDLKKELGTKQFSEKFYSILERNLSDDNSIRNRNNYHYIVGIKEGVISIFSDNKNQLKTDDKYIDWTTYASSSPNPTLAQNSLEDILSQENKLVYWQTSKIPYPEYKPISEPTLDNLEKLYKKYGVNILKNFSLLTASYITEEGDMFGTLDHTFMKENKNYKLLIVQSTNLYDLIKPYIDEPYVISINYHINDITLENHIKLKTFVFISLDLILVLVAVILSSIYNKRIN